MSFLQKIALIGLASLALSGCGSSSSGPTPDSYVFPAGKATLAFSAISTATLPASISGIDFDITLPPGITVATAGGASGAIETASVQPGAGLSGTNLAFGSYSTSTGKTRLSMATTSGSYRAGEFLRLACTIAPGTAITLGSLKAMNTPVTIVKAVGYDSATQDTVALTGNVKILLSVP